MTSPLRVVFFGTPDFAVPTLSRVLQSSHKVVGVVTQPDRPRGRGQHVSASPVKTRAIEAGVPVLQPERMKAPDFVEALRALGADIGVVAAYGRILTEELLALPPLGMINVHASLLPAYRGAAPIHRAVMAGDTHTGVTIMRVVKALDAGAMLATVTVKIGINETSADVERHLAVLGADLLVDTLDRLAISPVEERPQDDARATYAPRLTRDESPLDWALPAMTLHNRIRGLQPWPQASAMFRERRVIVTQSSLPGVTSEVAAPGTVMRCDSGELWVATGDGLIALGALQPEGKRVMAAADFMAGQRVHVGERFSTPA